MKIYLITAGSYSDYHIHAVFLTRELAQAYLDPPHSPAKARAFNEIEEWEVLDRLPRCAVVYAACGLVGVEGFVGYENHWEYLMSEIDGPLPGGPEVTVEKRSWVLRGFSCLLEITVRGADEAEVARAFQDRVAQARAELAGVAS